LILRVAGPGRLVGTPGIAERRMIPRRAGLICGLLLAALAAASPASAQLNTQHVKGSFGLKAGSAPPPGWYFVVPLLYFYNADDVRNSDGDRVPFANADISASLFAGGFSRVTTRKLFGASYGYTVLFPAGANNRLQGTEIDQNPGAGLTDTVIEPVSLGWHFKRADATAYYELYVPIGRYTDGASNNTGLGMWGHEVGVGFTAYLDEKKQRHVATMLSFNTQSKKEDSETKVGNQLNLEGGMGVDLLKGALTVGLDYYAAFKVSSDRIDAFPNVPIQGKNRSFALGPEVSIPLAMKRTVYGFLMVRYFWETYARTTTQGSGLIIQATLLGKPLHLPAQ